MLIIEVYQMKTIKEKNMKKLTIYTSLLLLATSISPLLAMEDEEDGVSPQSA
jgi:hypothetical protein